jgi:hypothetical protein
MQQPCLVCGRKPSDPYHLRYMQPRALGRKASDEFAVPLCRGQHRELHATSARGGSKPAPAGSGRRRTRWESGDLDEKQYLGQTALPSLRPKKRRNQRHRNDAG